MWFGLAHLLLVSLTWSEVAITAPWLSVQLKENHKWVSLKKASIERTARDVFACNCYFVIKSAWMLCTNLRKNKLQCLEYCLDSGQDLTVWLFFFCLIVLITLQYVQVFSFLLSYLLTNSMSKWIIDCLLFWVLYCVRASFFFFVNEIYAVTSGFVVFS